MDAPVPHPKNCSIFHHHRQYVMFGTLPCTYGQAGCRHFHVTLQAKATSKYAIYMKELRKRVLKEPEAQSHTIYNDGELAFCKDLHDIQSFLPLLLDVHAIVLVLEGKIVIDINGASYEVRKNDLLICPPNNIIEKGLTSYDIKVCSIFASSAYMQRILPMTENTWDFKLLFEKTPLCSLLPEEVKVFCQYYDLLCSKVQQATPASKKVIDTLVLAFFYDMKNLLERRMTYPKPHPFTSGELLFKRFIGLLESSYPKQRTVSYYADCLNISPKYLSAVCKQIGKQCPSAIIDSYVLKDIEYLMRHSQKSIKEIACELDFPNLSFFGKYVKKHCGMSPKCYREKYINQ